MAPFKYASQLRHDPLKAVAWALGIVHRARLRLHRRVVLGTGVRLMGKPIVDIRDGCRLTIGNNVLLNSRNRGYFASIYGPVKLFADNEGATITVGDNTRLHGSCLHAYKEIRIGKNCLIAGNAVIVDSDGHDPFPDELADRLTVTKRGRPVIIEDNVWIGLNCTILKGVHIGEGAIVGAGSVVRQDVPARSVAIGNPARVVKGPADESRPA